MRRLLIFSTVLFLLTTCLNAQNSESPESFRIELTGSAWLNGPTGTIQAEGTPVNFVTDLAAGSQEPRFYGRLIYKPARKHRIIVEGSPLSFSGVNTISRSIVFLNKTYTVNQTVSTAADVNYAFVGYQYDPVSGSYGHLGFQTGVAYLGVQGTLHGQQSGLSGTKSYQAPVPLIGTEFRVFPVPHHRIIQLEGMLRGITAGGYGYFIEGGASGGLRLGPVAVLAGYREMFADVHQDRANPDGVALHLKGPMFSLQWAW
jgi:hypothetical protein